VSETISFYRAAARRGRPIPASGRLLALTNLVRPPGDEALAGRLGAESEARAVALLGAPVWRGARASERDMALAGLIDRWEHHDLSAVSVADNLSALVALLAGTMHEAGAAQAEALEVISWLAEQNLRDRPSALPDHPERYPEGHPRPPSSVPALLGPQRLWLDPALLGLGRGIGIELYTCLPLESRRLPLLRTFWGHSIPEIDLRPAPPGTGYFPVLVLRSATFAAHPLSARTRVHFPLALSLDVFGRPDAEQSRAPDIAQVTARLAARNSALLATIAERSDIPLSLFGAF
jgi:hypothetical protein